MKPVVVLQTKLSTWMMLAVACFALAGCLNNKDTGSLVKTNGLLQLRPDGKTILFGQPDLHMDAVGGTPPYQFFIAQETSAHTINAATGIFHQLAVVTTETARVQVIDQVGDSAFANVYIAPTLTLTVAATAIVKNGTVTFTALGGSGNYTYSISIGPGTIAPDPFPATTATYTAPNSVGVAFISVTDGTGNVATANVTIIDDLLLTPTATNIPDMLVQQMLATGGQAPYTFALDPTTPFGSVNAATGLYTPAIPASTPAPVTINVTDTRSPIPITTSASLNVFVAERVAAGATHTCALTPLRKLECWGSNYWGQLGLGFSVYGDSSSDMGEYDSMTKLGLPAISLSTTMPYVVSMVTSGSHVCAILAATPGQTQGKVKCWGLNSVGQLGINNITNMGEFTAQMGDSLPFVLVDGTNPDVKKITMGYQHTCAMVYDTFLLKNKVKCWGGNSNGQLGQQAAGSTKIGGTGATVAATAYIDVGLTGSQNIIDIEAGGNTTCVIIAANATDTFGKVKCWGDSTNGQAGLNTSNSSIGTTGVSMGTNLLFALLDPNIQVKSLSVGDINVCAIVDNPVAVYTDQVVCWGGNTSAQLGLGSITGNNASIGDQPGEMASVAPINLGGAYSVKKLSTGLSHTCVVLNNTSIKCWGVNLFGELGLGTTSTVGNAPGQVAAETPITFTGAASVVDVSVGDHSTCALINVGGNVYSKCWGDNTYGTLGIEKAPSLADPTNYYSDANALLSLLPYTYLTTANTVSIVNAPRAGLYSTTLGQYVACAVMTDRVTVKCWGRPQGGAIGQSDPYVGDEPNEMGINLKPVSLGTGLDILEVKTHSSSNCALVRPVGLPDRKLKCWGYASNGNLGNGDAVYHRGDNASEMGDFLPFVNFGTHNVVDFSVGNNHACAILDGLTATQSGLTCWGAPNSYGALGNGVSGSNGTPGSGLVSAPSFVNFVYLGLGGTVKAVKVGAGNGLTCALGDDQRVYCFGDNANGELGMGNTANYSTRGTNSTTLYVPPIDLGTDSGLPLKIADIAVGDAHVCAMSITGRVKCWGYNGNGQLGLEYVLSPLDKIGDGLSEMGDNLAYTNFGTTTVARQVFAGPNNTCIISTLGKVSCIGYGLFGVNGVSGNTLSIGANANQMGDSLAPVDLGPNRTAITLSVGPDHMCAILDNNTLKCWGTNTYGQLGLGSRTMYGGSSANSMGIYLPFVSLYLGP